MKYSRLIRAYSEQHKLMPKLPADVLEEVIANTLTADQVIDFMTRQKLATKNTNRYADLLDKAIQKQQRISIIYAAAEDNYVEEKRIVTPLAFQIKRPKNEMREYVYLVAYNYEGGVRTYRFDRLKEVKTVSLPGKYEGPYLDYYTYYEDRIEPDFYEGLEDVPDFSKFLSPE